MLKTFTSVEALFLSEGYLLTVVRLTVSRVCVYLIALEHHLRSSLLQPGIYSHGKGTLSRLCDKAKFGVLLHGDILLR